MSRIWHVKRFCLFRFSKPTFSTILIANHFQISSYYSNKSIHLIGASGIYMWVCVCVCVFHRTDERRDTDRSGTLIQKQRFIGINVALISFSVSEIWKLKSKLFCFQIRTTLLIIGLLKNQFEEKDSFPERSKHIFGNLQMLWFHLPGENQKL